MGDYSRAKELLEGDYRFARPMDLNSGQRPILQGRPINLIRGKPDTALRQVREAIDLLSRDPKAALPAEYFSRRPKCFEHWKSG